MSDQDMIGAVLDRLRHAHATKDAAAIAALYAEDAVIYDLAPPLGRRGIDPGALRAWLDTWADAIVIDVGDVALHVDGGAAFCCALHRIRGTKVDGTAVDLWFRATLGLRRDEAGWRIAHEHSSVPFRMDGSERAALDLVPETAS
jgi:uncharacterized protein (TIGR02246 family)